MMSERELGIIIAKLDSIKEDIIELKNIQESNDKRIDSLERFKAWSTGVGAACVALFSFIITIIKS